MLVLLAVTGCPTFRPQPIETNPFSERAVTREVGKMKVTAAIPSPKECAALFGGDVAANLKRLAGNRLTQFNKNNRRIARALTSV